MRNCATLTTFKWEDFCSQKVGYTRYAGEKGVKFDYYLDVRMATNISHYQSVVNIKINLHHSIKM